MRLRKGGKDWRMGVCVREGVHEGARERERGS